MEEILSFEQVSYRYEDKYTGLKQVSTTIYKGEKIAVLGSNGAGKSTFFLCCNGVIRPQEGKIILKGQAIAHNKNDLSLLRQMVGLVFQEPDSQIIAGTVENEVSFGPMNLGLSKSEVQKRVADALNQMHLNGYQLRAPQYLSGGEKKRLSIADILAMQPEMILFDEPTASLDPENVTLLEQTLGQLSATGITLVVSTHDVDFAYRFATRGIVFCQGEIIMDAPIDQIFASSALSDAGLRKPLLYEVCALLEDEFSVCTSVPKPKNMAEFPQYIDQLKLNE